MADDLDDVVSNVKRSSTWMRIVFMIAFCVVLYVVSVVIWFLTGAQALFSIFTGSDNRNLRQLGASLAEYVNQILRFITFNSENRPFPFSPFPEGQAADSEIEEEYAAGGTQAGAETGAGEGPASDTGTQFDDLSFLSRQEEVAEEETPESQKQEVPEDDSGPEPTETEYDEQSIEKQEESAGSEEAEDSMVQEGESAPESEGAEGGADDSADDSSRNGR